MTAFEYIVASCLGVIAFVKLWDFVEFQIVLRGAKEDDD